MSQLIDDSASKSTNNAYSAFSQKNIWQSIIEQKNEEIENLNSYLQSKTNSIIVPENPHFLYLNENIFPILLPILEKTLRKAIAMDCLKHQKSLFNGIDYISEKLWIKNPNFPERQELKQNIFLLPWVQEWLKDHPRLIFPKSWIWTKEQAVVIIQSHIRGYFVRRTVEVQEMRQFWKILKEEKMRKKQNESEDKPHISDNTE